MKKIAKICIIGLFFFSTPLAEAQCPLCKTTVKSNNNGQKAVGMGLNNGILFLMAVPYLIAGSAGFIWYKKSKKNRQNLDLSEHF